MLSVAEALARILDACPILPAEQIALAEGRERVLAEDLVARRTQPPQAISAMDGYAARSTDLAALPARLRIVETIPAGRAPQCAIRPGEAARIFTGAFLPDGADLVVIQENCERDAKGGEVVVTTGDRRPGQHIRKAGLDFKAGEIVIPAGTRLSPVHLALAAAMDRPWLMVRRQPRIALLATGDELVYPGEPSGPAQIVASNGIGLAALIAEAGGQAIDLGIAGDDAAAIGAAIDRAQGCDLLVTMGGASVGEFDLVQSVMRTKGFALDFWKIAMRPGKPVLFGRRGDMPLLGLPGNPVSALVTAILFLKPVLGKMSGIADPAPRLIRVRLAEALKANDQREDYLRSRLAPGTDGLPLVTPFSVQDSAMVSALARADALVIRPPFAPAASAGDLVPIVLLD